MTRLRRHQERGRRPATATAAGPPGSPTPPPGPPVTPAPPAGGAVAAGPPGLQGPGEVSPDGGSGPAAPSGGAVPAVPATRASAVWTAVVVGLVLLAVVLVFILQNLQDVDVSFFGARWRIPLGVDLLLAAVLGGLVTVTAGAVRLLQLRRVARRHAKGRAQG